MDHKRTPLGRFIHSSWANINIRCGKYKKLNPHPRNKCYASVEIEFTREQYKEWCYENKTVILNLKRPSVDRLNSNKNYSLDNIQVIELEQNIAKKRLGNSYIGGPKENTLRGVRETKLGENWSARITYKNKETYLGTFYSKEEAYKAYSQAYVKIYGKPPF